MARRLLADRRGISPVVATVILVAVTIVVAVAVAYWMGGLTAIYTRFEKLEITSAYPTFINEDKEGWNITITLKNTGSADATIDNILLNGKPYTQYQTKVGEVNKNITTSPDLRGGGITIKVGQEKTIIISIPYNASDSNWPFQHGVSVEVRLHSAAGQEYPKTITLP